MGYDLRYADSTWTLEHRDSYPEALAAAQGRVARAGRAVVIANAWDGEPYAIVRPDGSVSASAGEQKG